jgi:hypothetical protein
MKLTFSWSENPTGKQPICSSDVVDSSGLSPLCSILMDDGGVDLKTSVAWLKEGVACTDAVISGAAKDRADWDRESWGSSVTSVDTTIYSMPDEHCTQTVSTADFRQALIEWLHFVEASNGAHQATVELNNRS